MNSRRVEHLRQKHLIGLLVPGRVILPSRDASLAPHLPLPSPLPGKLSQVAIVSLRGVSGVTVGVVPCACLCAKFVALFGCTCLWRRAYTRANISVVGILESPPFFLPSESYFLTHEI